MTERLIATNCDEVHFITVLRIAKRFIRRVRGSQSAASTIGWPTMQIARLAVQASCVRSTRNLELMTNPIGMLALESERVPGSDAFGAQVL